MKEEECGLKPRWVALRMSQEESALVLAGVRDINANDFRLASSLDIFCCSDPKLCDLPFSLIEMKAQNGLVCNVWESSV